MKKYNWMSNTASFLITVGLFGMVAAVGFLIKHFIPILSNTAILSDFYMAIILSVLLVASTGMIIAGIECGKAKMLEDELNGVTDVKDEEACQEQKSNT